MRHLLLAVVLLLAAGRVVAQFEKQEVAVREALAQRRSYKALSRTERALTRGAPPIFHVLRADAMIQLGRYDQALEEVRKAEPTLGRPMEVRSQLIGAFIGSGRLDSALSVVSAGLPGEGDATYRFRCGQALMKVERWSEAIEQLDRGVAAFPSDPRLIRERGACHAMLGDSAKARADLDQAVQLAPRSAVAYNSRGHFRWALFGEHQRAVADMDLAIKHDPNYGYAFSNRGWSLFQLGQAGRARKDLGLALRKDPDNALAHYRLGLVDLHERDTVAACARFNKALQLGLSMADAAGVQGILKEHCPTPLPAAKDTQSLPVPDRVPPAPNAPQIPNKQNAP